MLKSIIRLLLFVAAILITAGAAAQDSKREQQKPTYIIVGDKLQKKEYDSQAKQEPVQTEWSLQIKDSTYTVWKGTKGSYYIWRTSKKTGKKYKQYLKIEEPVK